MKFSFLRANLPKPLNVFLALLSAFLLMLSFPDFDLWFIAWFALIPFFYALQREKASIISSGLLGWVFGTAFFAGSCWWLTFSMITYGGLPVPLAYLLLLIITIGVSVLFGAFGAGQAFLFKKLGSYAVFAAPFLWVAAEFGRYWLIFNNWNSIAYSQAFNPTFIQTAQYGGIYLVGFLIVLTNAFICFIFLPVQKKGPWFRLIPVAAAVFVIFTIALSSPDSSASEQSLETPGGIGTVAGQTNVVAIQANVPMSGLNLEKWLDLRARHVRLAGAGIEKLKQRNPSYKAEPLLVIFPESPMNFMFEDDPAFRAFIKEFAVKNGAYVLFNSAEPNPARRNYFNSAVLVDPRGEKIGQYDKIHLVPFGEYAPVPEFIDRYVPKLVGNFELGKEYDLFPIGEAKAGILICYESHFPTLARRFVADGADVLIEMTNDGYLGKTGVLKQHLASAVFRAVETNRPVLRTTNVGITAYITGRGEIEEPSESYTEDIRVWTMSKTDGPKTFYVRYGDWFAWLAVLVSLGLLGWAMRKKIIED